jgi:deoxyribonuclease-4
MGAGTALGLARAARTLDRVLARAAEGPRVLLELTCGAGTLLGGRLEEIEEIIARSRFPERLGVCVDTCHVFASGYSIDEPDGYEGFWDELERRLGRDRLGAIHLNDSQHPRGSRRDRHAPIGRGQIGDETFTRLLRDERLRAVPMVVETPSDEQDRGHARDLRRLRRLVARAAGEVEAGVGPEPRSSPAGAVPSPRTAPI